MFIVENRKPLLEKFFRLLSKEQIIMLSLIYQDDELWAEFIDICYKL